MSDWIQTYTGKKFYSLDPNPDDIDIKDIAHALSMICRFNGHCSRFYSVAEHSILVASVLKEKYKELSITTRQIDHVRMLSLAGLLHDASEAYLLDIPTPVKKQLPEYKYAESKLQKLIMQKFGLYPLDTDKITLIKIVDRNIVYNEAEELMPVKDNPWHHEYGPPCDVHILGLLPPAAESWFLRTFERLTSGVVSTPQEYDA